jgi:hypothetical protein
MTNGNSSKGWDISFDLFPPEDKIIHGVLRNRLTLVAEGAEENDYDRDVDMEYFDKMKTPPLQRASSNININTTAPTPQKLFLKLTQQYMVTTTSYVEQWENHELDQIEWETLEDEDEISWGMPKPDPEGSILKLFFDNGTNLDKMFFDKIMTYVSGNCLLMDKYFEDPHADMHLTVNNANIRFHDPEADDPS